MSLNQKGQFTDNVGSVIALILLIAIGAFVSYSIIGGFDKDIQKKTFTTKQREFDSVTAWTLENTGALKVEHTGENIRLYSTDDENGAGTVTVSQAFDVQVEGGINDGLMETSWYIENVDNFEAENTYLRLRDPSGNIEAEIVGTNDSPGVSTSWAENAEDITDVIDEDGTWTLEMFFESQDNGDGVNAYIDNSQADVEITTYAGSTIHDVESKGSTAFNLMTILVIVIVAAVIIGVVLRSLAGGTGRSARPAPAY